MEQCKRIARLPHTLACKCHLLRAPLSRTLYGADIHLQVSVHEPLAHGYGSRYHGPQSHPYTSL